MTKKERLMLKPENLICYICGKSINLQNANIDHVIPRSRGGSNKMGNLRLVHIQCNSKKSNLLPTEILCAVPLDMAKIRKFSGVGKIKKKITPCIIKFGALEHALTYGNN